MTKAKTAALSYVCSGFFLSHVATVAGYHLATLFGLSSGIGSGIGIALMILGLRADRRVQLCHSRHQLPTRPFDLKVRYRTHGLESADSL